MHCVAAEEVLRAVEEKDGRVVDMREDGWAGPQWRSMRYLVRKGDSV
ncbi:MAG: hypothetical protein IT158_25165 [Bryobacterales bacterium]|nr:hypothetical protein [Bryobacterales bacterium]